MVRHRGLAYTLMETNTILALTEFATYICTEQRAYEVESPYVFIDQTTNQEKIRVEATYDEDYDPCLYFKFDGVYKAMMRVPYSIRYNDNEIDLEDLRKTITKAMAIILDHYKD